MPVEVEIDGKRVTVPMTGGRGTLSVPASARVVVDPDARILRRSVAVEAMQAWQAERAAAGARR